MKSNKEIQEMKQHNLKLPSLTTEKQIEIKERPKVQCPACKKSFVVIKKHLNQSRCKAELDQDEVEKIEREANKAYILNQRDSAAARKAKSRERKKKEDYEAQKIKERLMKAYKRKATKELDQEAFKKPQNEQKNKKEELRYLKKLIVLSQ